MFEKCYEILQAIDTLDIHDLRNFSNSIRRRSARNYITKPLRNLKKEAN